MKLFSKKRLQISREGTNTNIRWWSLSGIELFLMFFLAIALIMGIGSIIGAEEILDMKVISMGNMATLVYWSVWGMILMHLIFNRSVLLEISPERLKYKKRLFLGISRNVNIKEIAEVRIEEKAENFAESPVGGRDLSAYHLLIFFRTEKRIKIKGLSEADAEIIQKKIYDCKSAHGDHGG